MRSFLVLAALYLLAEASASGTRKPECYVPIPNKDKPRVITFHFGGDFPPFDYLEDTPNPETQAGFGIDFARKLCQMYELRCEFVRQSYEECWKTNNYPGAGIYDGSYDACSTYTNTFLRQTGVDFSFAYVKKQPAGILTRLVNKKPVIRPNQHDLEGRKIAIVPGWSTDAASFIHTENGCTGKAFTNYTLLVPNSNLTGPDAAFEALIEGRVDAVYARTGVIHDRKDCQGQNCKAELYDDLGTNYAWIHTGINDNLANGTTLSMTKKGSKLNAFLNPLIQCFMESEDYAILCEERDGEDIVCFTNDHMKRSSKIPQGYLPNTARIDLCREERSDAKRADCDSCKSGYCGCAA